MKLYYTGASAYNAAQQDKSRSLGGYVSSTFIPNNRLGNLLSELSLLSIQELTVETKGVALKNELGVTATNLYIFIVYPEDCKVKLEVAAVSINSSYAMEKIGISSDSPFIGTFVEPKATYAYGDLIITVEGENGETLTVLGVDTDPLTQAVPTKENCVDAIVSAFLNNATYSASKLNSTTVRIKRKTVGINTSAITLTSDGVAEATPTNFGGGTDNRVLLTASMLANGFIGLWFRRTILPQTLVDNDTLKSNYVDGVSPTLTETIEINFEWT